MTDIDDLARCLRDELAEMASTASVNMTLWDKFSNRVLSAAHTLEQQEKAIKRLNQMCKGYRDGAKEAGVLIDERDARISELEAELNLSKRVRLMQGINDADENTYVAKTQKQIAELVATNMTLWDTNEKLHARIAELEAENKTLIKLQEPHYASSEVVPENQLEHMLYDTITERNELKDRITELEAALKPFGDDAKWLDKSIDNRSGIRFDLNFTVGDIRNAYTVLNKTK